MKTTDTKPIEVTEKQYYLIMGSYAGCAAGRKADGKFYLKVWMYRKEILFLLEQ